MSTRRTLTVGLIGYRFMGKAHSNAWRQAPRFFDLPADLRLKTICGRNQAAVSKAAKPLGWEKAESNWRRVIDDPQVDIIDICTANDTHSEIAMAAARAGKAAAVSSDGHQQRGGIDIGPPDRISVASGRRGCPLSRR